MAFVDLQVTGAAAVAGWAGAHESGGGVLACAMRARFLGAHDGLLLAVAARPALVAFAFVALLRWIVGAHAAVQARPVLAFAHLDLALGAGEAGRTDACVRTLAGVVACAIILAWPMIGAVVQVLIAEQATPAFAAMAFPWLLTGSVNAARIRLTFVTLLALPAGLTAANEKDRKT